MAEKITTRLRDIASGMNAPVNQATLREAADKIESMFKLLLECRDALPAITLVSARLRGIDLRLADRIEDCIEPWRLPAESQSDRGADV